MKLAFYLKISILFIFLRSINWWTFGLIKQFGRNVSRQQFVGLLRGVTHFLFVGVPKSFPEPYLLSSCQVKDHRFQRNVVQQKVLNDSETSKMFFQQILSFVIALTLFSKSQSAVTHGSHSHGGQHEKVDDGAYRLVPSSEIKILYKLATSFCLHNWQYFRFPR